MKSLLYFCAMDYSDDKSIYFPNLLLIAGNGRDVGKTWLACHIIEQLSLDKKVTAIKISSHFHPVDAEAIIIQNDRFVISYEKRINSKDSSLMLQAGAEKVYFIMAPPQHLQEAFNFLAGEFKNKILVCESGGLIDYINPGIFLFVMKQKSKIQKPHLLKYSPVIVKNNDNKIEFDISRISVPDGKFILEK